MGNATTAVGLRDGPYRVVLRTGDFDPSLMSLTGQFVSYSVLRDASSNFTVTTQMVKDFIAGPTADPIARLKGSISVSTSGQAPVATAQTLSFTTDANGVRVNFNLTHFSAPNPSLKINVPASTTVTTVSALSVKVSNSASAKSIAAFGKLVVPSTSKVSLEVSSGSALKGLKAGSCKLTVTVTPKKGKAVSKTLTVKITK